MSENAFSMTTLHTPSARGKPIRGGARKKILNAYSRLREENPDGSITDIAGKVAQLTGVSSRTVFRILKEKKTSGPIITPGKKRPGLVGKQTRLMKYDDFTLSRVRSKYHDFFRCNEIPTVEKILKELKDDPDIFPENICRTTLYRLFKDMGFSFQKRPGQSLLLEAQDIIMWRRDYLRKIKKLKSENAPVYYLGETCVNEGHSKNSMLQDTELKSSYEASTSNSTVPKEKGRRLIIIHIGNDDGFVPGSVDILVGKKSGDFHLEIDESHFEKWLESVLPKLEPKSVVVMDNAPNHSVKLEKIPTSSWEKSAIREWLSQKQIDWTEDMIKIELLKKVSEVKHLYDNYRVDAIVEKFGHTVLRLPPFHYELNPIEIVWAQVKEYVASENKTFQLADVMGLVLKGIEKVTPRIWRNCIQHVTEKENEMWGMDGLIDDVLERHDMISMNGITSDSEDQFSHHF